MKWYMYECVHVINTYINIFFSLDSASSLSFPKLLQSTSLSTRVSFLLFLQRSGQENEEQRATASLTLGLHVKPLWYICCLPHQPATHTHPPANYHTLCSGIYSTPCVTTYLQSCKGCQWGSPGAEVRQSLPSIWLLCHFQFTHFIPDTAKAFSNMCGSQRRMRIWTSYSYFMDQI